MTLSISVVPERGMPMMNMVRLSESRGDCAGTESNHFTILSMRASRAAAS